MNLEAQLHEGEQTLARIWKATALREAIPAHLVGVAAALSAAVLMVHAGIANDSSRLGEGDSCRRAPRASG